MVDNLPAGRGVVAIGINNNRFHFTPAQVALQAQGIAPAAGLAHARQVSLPQPAERSAHGAPARHPAGHHGLSGRGRRRAVLGAGQRPGDRPHLPAPLGHVEAGVVDRSQARRVQQWVASHRASFVRITLQPSLLDVLVRRAKQRLHRRAHRGDRGRRHRGPLLRPVQAGLPAHRAGHRREVRRALHRPAGAAAPARRRLLDYLHMDEPGRLVWEPALAAALHRPPGRPPPRRRPGRPRPRARFWYHDRETPGAASGADPRRLPGQSKG